MLTNTHHDRPVPLHPQDSTPRRYTSIPPVGAARRMPPLTNSHISAGTVRTLSVAMGGRWAKLKASLPADRPRPTSRRGKVTTFSVKSRSRMIQAMCQLSEDRLPQGVLFETLTYPRRYSGEPADWHRDLDEWVHRFLEDHPDAFLMWKLEFQKRGAPHFHLLIFGVDWTPQILELLQVRWRGWWYEIVGSGDGRHARKGAYLEVVQSIRQVTRYASKYIGKPDESIRSGGTGRIWGIRNRKAAPRTIHTAELSDREFFVLRRAFKRFMGARRGLFRPGGADSGCWAAIGSRTVIRYMDHIVAEAGGARGVGAFGRIVETTPRGSPGFPWEWLELGPRTAALPPVRAN